MVTPRSDFAAVNPTVLRFAVNRRRIMHIPCGDNNHARLPDHANYGV